MAVSVCPSGVHVYVDVRCEMMDLEPSTCYRIALDVNSKSRKLMANLEYDKFGVILFGGC